LSILAGNLNTDDRLTMASNANGDSRISEIVGGSIIGDVVTQRYIDAGATNWRFLTSPTQGNTIGDWSDDFSTSGFIGSTWPTFSFTSIYFHDETAPGTLDDGFVAASDVTDPIAPGQGVWVWCGDSLQGTAPFTIDVTGEVYQGDVDLPVSYTSYGNPADDGWNMVANPYVSVIDWDDPDWVKTGINDAIYIWVPELEQFASYVAGVGVNGGSRFIASSQAFWVQTNSSSPQLTAKESVKSEIPVGFRSTAVQDNDVLRLSLSRNGISDQLVIRYNGGASNDFDNGFDAVERISPTTTAPNFHSVSADGKDLMINTMKPVTNDTVIQLAFKVNQGGTYHVNFDEVAGRFASSCIILEDQIAGTETPVDEGGTISVSLVPGQNEDRFSLRISGTIEAEQFPVSCPGATDGMLVAHVSGVGPWNYRWYNGSGILIRTSGPISGPDTLRALSPGSYSVSVTVQSICGQITAAMNVLDAQPLDPNETITASSCTGQGDGMIELGLAGDSDNYSILWSDGSTGESLTDLLAGDYTVTITTAGGCVSEFTFTVPMENQAVAAFSAPSTASVNQPIIFQSTSQGATTVTWDMGDGASYNVQAPMHQYAAPGTYSVTLTAVNSSCSDVYTQDIVIEAIANSISELNGSAGITFQQVDDRIYLMNNGQRPRAMTVMINNLLGQNIGLPINRKFDVGRTFLDVGDSRGTVIIITAVDHVTGQRYGKRFLL
jgi:hypothetical protein